LDTFFRKAVPLTVKEQQFNHKSMSAQTAGCNQLIGSGMPTFTGPLAYPSHA
jgi:hypothetical protein